MNEQLGSVVSLWRYPVKSMQGERLDSIALGPDGLRGDRGWALRDGADGKIATAKNPRKWPNLLNYRADWVEPSDGGKASVRITLPDGTCVSSSDGDADQVLGRAVGRPVTLAARGLAGSLSSEEYWPDMEGLDHRDTVTDFELPAGTFFDCAPVHLLTTASLDLLGAVRPQASFEPARFRPNILIEPAGGEVGFIEGDWVGAVLSIGAEVRLRVTGPCGRCVMTTLAQGDLPHDPSVLATAVRNNRGQVGVYAAVERGGTIRRKDRVLRVA